MCDISCYSQDLDFSLVEHGNISANMARLLLRQLPRTDVARQFLEQPGPCRPMVGLSCEPDASIEFAVNADGTFYVRLEIRESTGNSVWSLSDGWKCAEATGVSAASAERLVQPFYEQRFGFLIDRLSLHDRDRD